MKKQLRYCGKGGLTSANSVAARLATRPKQGASPSRRKEKVVAATRVQVPGNSGMEKGETTLPGAAKAMAVDVLGTMLLRHTSQHGMRGHSSRSRLPAAMWWLVRMTACPSALTRRALLPQRRTARTARTADAAAAVAGLEMIAHASDPGPHRG